MSHMKKKIYHLDCTLRDGGYYNSWNFSEELVKDYLDAMDALNIDFLEIGFRTIKNDGFKGAFAFSTDQHISSLDIPLGLKDKIGVMINGSEISNPENQNEILNKLFNSKVNSPVTLVRIACQVHEFLSCLPAAKWLSNQGYKVGFNLMQVSDRSLAEISELANKANDYPIDCLYFADSMGSLSPVNIADIVNAFKKEWKGEIGIHTHDNMGLALSNTLRAIDEGVTWIDSTVTGMGRGPGNAQTEYLCLELENLKSEQSNYTKLFEVIRVYFKAMQQEYGWGSNPFYYLAGKYGIHPSYIQFMLQDSRYNEVEIIAVIEHLKLEGGKKFSIDTLDNAKYFYSKDVLGSWSPKTLIEGRQLLILGAGPSVDQYRDQIEVYIYKHKPFVLALNTQKNLSDHLINARAACHPVRLLADCQEYLRLPQPLITPASMLPNNVTKELNQKELFDFGIYISPNQFKVADTHCVISTSLVFAYALAIASSGKAKEIALVGFDGFGADDPRRKEMDELIHLYESAECTIPFFSLTPTRYEIPIQSIFGKI